MALVIFERYAFVGLLLPLVSMPHGQSSRNTESPTPKKTSKAVRGTAAEVIRHTVSEPSHSSSRTASGCNRIVPAEGFLYEEMSATPAHFRVESLRRWIPDREHVGNSFARKLRSECARFSHSAPVPFTA